MARQHLLDRHQHPVPRWPRASLPPLLVALDQRQEMLAAPEEPQDAEDDRLERRVHRAARAGRRLDVDRQPLEARLQRHAVQVVLGGEVEVDRPLPDAGARRHVAHLNAVEIALGEHRGGGGEDALALVVVGHAGAEGPPARTDRSVLTVPDHHRPGKRRPRLIPYRKPRTGRLSAARCGGTCPGGCSEGCQVGGR